MAPSKDALPVNRNILGITGLSGKTVTGISAYQHGNVWVIEVAYSGGPSYIKVKGMQMEIGGTNEWGSGTLQ
jgi:hypothetical protein